MTKSKKKIFAICGSTRKNSANLQLLRAVAQLSVREMEIEIFEDLALLPHFNPDLDNETPPAMVEQFRDRIKHADGILICTPEYVFSLPGSLKNAIEWCVSTTVLSDKPLGIITASALGEKAHESLQLIMKTVQAKTTEQTQVLISGVRTKVNEKGEIIDGDTLHKVKELITSFTQLMDELK